MVFKTETDKMAGEIQSIIADSTNQKSCKPRDVALQINCARLADNVDFNTYTSVTIILLRNSGIAITFVEQVVRELCGSHLDEDDRNELIFVFLETCHKQKVVPRDFVRDVLLLLRLKILERTDLIKWLGEMKGEGEEELKAYAQQLKRDFFE